MYKIIVVDDEIEVREGIKERVDWFALGLELVGDYEDGREALDSMDALRPDIVITDINMPYMDGLELTKRIVKEYPRTKVIILTGYDQFEYAQQAIKLRVYEYILKPVSARLLSETLQKVKMELDNEHDRMKNFNNMQTQFQETLPLMKEIFLNRLINDELDPHMISQKLERFQIEMQWKYSAIIVVDPDDLNEIQKRYPNKDMELLYFALRNICEELSVQRTNSHVFQNRNYSIVIICGHDEYGRLEEVLAEIAEAIRQAVEYFLKFTISVGVGSIVEQLSQLHRSCHEALSALDYRYFLGGNQVISYLQMNGSVKKQQSDFRALGRKLIQEIKAAKKAEVHDICEHLFDYLKETNSTIDQCYLHVQQLLVTLFYALEEMGIPEESVFEENPFSLIYGYKTIIETKTWFYSLCMKIIEYMNKKKNDYSGILISNAEQFIKNNYQEPKLSINIVCKHLLVSTSYFSTMFKKHTAQTFTEYLTSIRIEEAKELLIGTSYKTYEIAEQIGFNDPQYFSNVFKKVCGMSPTDYRAICEREEGR